MRNPLANYARKRMKKLALLVAAVAVAATVPALPGVGADAAAAKLPSAAKSRLKPFRSCGAIVRYGRRNVRKTLAVGGPVFGGVPQPLASPRDGAEEAPASGGGGIGGGDSGTNVQEAGVDEADTVKSADGRIFSVADTRLHAVDAAQARHLGSLELEGWGHALLLYGDRLLVISYDQSGGRPGAPSPGVVGDVYYPGDTVTVLSEVDVSDPAAMKVVHTERIRGDHVSSRLTGHTARVVVVTRPKAVAQPELRGAVRGWLPRRALRAGVSGRPRYRRGAPCKKVLRTATFTGTDVLTVLTVDLEKGLPAVDSDAILSGGQIVYGSQASLYVATQDWTPPPESAREAPPSGSFTTIHRFDVSDPGSTTYRSTGVVPGYLLNQFALSEHDGVLRAATTDSPDWWGGRPRRESQSYVTTLKERGKVLERLGRVSGLGRDERIYAVRFIGDKGYVVTFRQVDPLYVLDLSDPGNPAVRGELKIRGYSAYLHPVGDNLLLGVGQDATSDGQTQGTQISLFDVSDPERPVRLQNHTLGQYSSSQVEYDHHAFLWWEPTGLAVLPISQYTDAGDSFLGAVGLKVSREGGIQEAGWAEHRRSGYAWEIGRSLVVGGRLFTVSAAGMELNDLGTLREHAWIPFPGNARGAGPVSPLTLP